MNTDETLATLLEGWLDGGLPEATQSDLLRQLDEDAELRHRFAEQVAMLGATRAASEANPRWLALFDLMDREQAPDRTSPSFEVATMQRIKSARRPRRKQKPVVWALAAAVALLLAGGFLLKLPLTTPAPTLASAIPPSVAVVIGGSPEAGHATGTYLQPGTISQAEGWLTVQTLTGVSVTFDAPFEAILSDADRIYLGKGRARVRVPLGAEGFRLESPAFDVVDLGTEFATKVNDDGTGTCRVFEGKADVSLLDSVGEVKRTRRLTASRSLQINASDDVIQVIEENDADYPLIKQAPRPLLTLAPTYPAAVLGMGPAAYWRFEKMPKRELVNEVPGRIAMQAVGSAALAAEGGGNHSGELTQRGKAGFFTIHGNTKPMFKGDFSIGYFAQLSWLQNFAMISSMRYDESVRGHPFILQCYASLSKRGIPGTALHAVFRDPPGWDGGEEIFDAAPLRPLQWHHIAMTRENGVATLFLDGTVVTRKTVGSMPLDCRDIFVGRLNGNFTQPLTEARAMVGHIDELAIFPRALSVKEVARLAVHGAGQD